MSYKDKQKSEKSYSLITYILVPIISLIIALLYLPPSSFLLDIDPTSFVVPLPESLEPYETEFNLKSFKKLESKITGPESIAYYKNRLVTSSSDGILYEINLKDDTTKPIIKVISNDTLTRFHGIKEIRPLGITFDSRGNLWVTEPYFGIYKVENIFTKPKAILVFDIDQTKQLGSLSLFLDDVTVVEKEDGGEILFITDVSQKFTLKEFRHILFGDDQTGRVISYDTTTKNLETLVDNLNFPNGIEMLSNKKGFIFSELGRRVIWKYDLVEKKAIKLLQNLPAETDNIRVSANGKSYWLAMVKPRSKDQAVLLDKLSNFPKIRKLIGRLIYLIGKLVKLPTIFISSDFLNNLAYQITSFEFTELFHSTDGSCMLIEIDENGNILTGKRFENDPNYGWISEVREVVSENSNERILYIGSPFKPFLRKVIFTR